MCKTATGEELKVLRLQVSELRHAKEQAEAGNRAQWMLVCKSAHELRGPLNAIVGIDVPIGDGHLIGAYDQHRVAGVTVTSKAALGYQYNLNKNAKLFATIADDAKAAANKTGYDLGLIYSW